MEVGKLCFFEENLYIEDDIFKRIYNNDGIDIFQDEKFKRFLASGEFQEMESSEKLFYAVAALLQFVGSNFTGPDVSTDSSISIKFLEDPVSILKVDGIDQIDPNFKNVEYLCSAKVILDDLVKTQYDDFATNLWYLRSLVIHQKVLEDNSNTIYEKILKVVEKLKDQLTAFPKERHRFLVHVEIVQSLMNYKRVNQIESLLEELKTDFKIQTIVEGILGVRTKFQQKPLPQLHLTVKFDNEIFSTPSKDTHKTTKLTEILILDDEVRLEQIKFCSDEYNQVQELNSAIQTLLLLFIKFLEISQPKDKLADEEIRPYITTLLSQQNGPWIVRLHTLLTNIKLEANHRRTVERSLRQCEELVTIFKNGDAGEFKNRSSYIFSSLLIPRHEVESQLANLMVSLGLIKGALDVYLKLQQWEEVINCYTILQLRHKAAEVINQELAKKPTVKLYCMLGDATDDVACYEKAWEFSNFTSGRAQRHWGNYYFARKEYSEAIPHLQKSLEINSLQEVTWLRLGYSALSLENWELAAHAYVRYTQLETNGFESWNNLAKCYIKMNDKKRAHKILQESLKCNFNNWKVWENFLLVSIDIGSFEDAINAYNQIIELREKEKYFDEEILGILVNAVAGNVIDVNGNSSGRLKKKLIELLAQLSVKIPSQGITWELSVKLTDQPLLKAQKLQNAYRGYLSKSLNWSKDEKMALKMLKISMKLCETSLEAANNFEEKDRMSIFSQLSSARLTGQSCTKAVAVENFESCSDLIKKVQSLVEIVTSKIKEIKP